MWRAALLLLLALSGAGCGESGQVTALSWPAERATLDVQQSQIAFANNDVQARWGPDVDELRRLVLARGKADEKLVIIGLFRPQESVTHNGINLGYMRAQAARTLFSDLPVERIDVEAMKSNDNHPNAPLIRLEWRAVIAPVFPATPYPLAFAFGSAAPITSEQIEAFKHALNTGMPNQRLEITIRYFEGEDEALARERGQAVQKLLEPVIDAKRTLVVLRSEGTWPFGEGTGELTQFRWLD